MLICLYLLKGQTGHFGNVRKCPVKIARLGWGNALWGWLGLAGTAARQRTARAVLVCAREGVLRFEVACCKDRIMQTEATTLERPVRQTTLDARSAPQGGRDVTRVGKGKPGPGRVKGSQNRVNRTIKEAIEIAARDCHPHGLAGWLIERAQGSLGDRQIFAGLVQKALPAQLQANVQHGGVVVQLGWLAGRSIGRATAARGTSTSQLEAVDAQLVEIAMNSNGDLRVEDPRIVQLEAGPGGAEADSDPHPPVEPGVGGLE